MIQTMNSLDCHQYIKQWQCLLTQWWHTIFALMFKDCRSFKTGNITTYGAHSFNLLFQAEIQFSVSENDSGQLQSSETLRGFDGRGCWNRLSKSCLAFVITLRHRVDDGDDEVNNHNNYNFLIEPRQPAWLLQQHINAWYNNTQCVNSSARTHYRSFQRRYSQPITWLVQKPTLSSQPISWLILVNKIKQQPNYNTNNLNDTYK